ncbi:hypothetical protein NHX12_003033 [Muraenolepis orangiensis]|uniref:Ras-associating domain-containing protein n=1 Tax=Muraenolepis orangiensis TaxID=630683 RepID=A0A9Q0DVN2_9TELE|nr:hypothetical protein NHX12_003033 [Muraenolepis orangiensis]
MPRYQTSSSAFLSAANRTLLSLLRTKDPEVTAVGKEIQVWVFGEEKVVCGVTKHTTCADMVQALLEHQGSLPEGGLLLVGEAKDFCLVELWKGLERALPPLTRILRLWNAWGDQKPLIRFVLVKVRDSVPRPGEKPKPDGAKRRERAHPALPQDRQKRVVKKAFRKLEKLHRASTRSSPGSEEVDRMVRLILAQDHALREQGRQLEELDADIRRSELCGAQGGDSALDPEEVRRDLRSAEDRVDRLELRVQEHRDLILRLSRDIDLELGATAAREGAAAGPRISDREAEADASFYAAELEMLRSELQLGMSSALSLQLQAAQMEQELRFYDSAMASKDQECWQLASQLSSMQPGGVGEENGSPTPPGSMQPGGVGEETGSLGTSATPAAAKSSVCCTLSPATARLKHSVSPEDITDTDSDTGISSTHSQDSLSPCLELLPPGDTDV